MIEKRIVALLLADAGVSALIGTKIAPVVLRVETGMPCLVYRRLDGQPEYTLAGRAGWRTVTVQIACWDGDYTDAKTLAEAVRDALDAYSEIDSAGSIRFISVADGADEYQGDLDAYAAVVVLTIDYDDEAVSL